MFLPASLLLLLVIDTVLCHTESLVSPLRRTKDEAWGYVPVRPGAQIFFWLMTADGTKLSNPESLLERPLVVWLQGGPGVASSGTGNFGEIGPFDGQLRPRTFTWRRSAHLLFIDAPAGTGFSFADTLATNRRQVAEEILVTLNAVRQSIPGLDKTRTYIFAESYGPRFAVATAKLAVEQGLDLGLQGLALLDGLLAPIENVKLYIPFLLSFGLIDIKEAKYLNDTFIVPSLAAYDRGDYFEANRLRWAFRSTVTRPPFNIYIFNVMQPVGRYVNVDCFDSVKPHKGPLFELMNGKIRRKLEIIPTNHTWWGRSCAVNVAHGHDIMKPATDDIEWLLANTNLSVAVINGQLDMNIPSEATQTWVSKLRWKGQSEWLTANKTTWLDSSDRWLAWIQEHDRLSLYVVADAGHKVPHDVPETSLRMMRRITGQSEEDNVSSSTGDQQSIVVSLKLLFLWLIAQMIIVPILGRLI